MRRSSGGQDSLAAARDGLRWLCSKHCIGIDTFEGTLLQRRLAEMPPHGMQQVLAAGAVLDTIHS